MLKRTCFLLLSLFSIVSQSQDFRNVNWGMKIDSVKNIENAKLAQEYDNFLVYEEHMLGRECLLKYEFADSLLAKAEYNFGEKKNMALKYSAIADEIKEQLTLKYGEPKHKFDYSTEKMIKWESETTIIVLLLSDFAGLKILYDSKMFLDKLKKEKNKNINKL